MKRELHRDINKNPRFISKEDLLEKMDEFYNDFEGTSTELFQALYKLVEEFSEHEEERHAFMLTLKACENCSFWKKCGKEIGGHICGNIAGEYFCEKTAPDFYCGNYVDAD